MIIYKDFITGDELFSDTYPVKIVHELIYEVQGKITTETTNVDDSLIGGNPSAEGEDAGASADPSSQSGCNIVLANRLVETSYSKKDFRVYFKKYVGALLKRVKEEEPAREDAFKKGMMDALKKVEGNFDNWQFFMGESMNPDGMVALMDFRDDGSPYMWFFKDGIVEEKV